MGKQRYRESPSDKERKRFAKFLAEDEELILAAGYGAIYMRQKFIIYIMLPGMIFWFLGMGVAYFWQYPLGLGLLGGLVLSIVFAWIKSTHTYHSHRYLLTTRRVIIKKGFFTVKLMSALYDKITHIEVDQGLMDRLIMHHGTIIVNAAGMTKGEFKLDYVDSPIEFKNLLERLINKEREQYGRGLGSVTTLEGEIID